MADACVPQTVSRQHVHVHALRQGLANGIQKFLRVVQRDTCASSCTRCHPPTVFHCHGRRGYSSLPPPPPPSPVRAAVVGTALGSVVNSRTAKAREKPEYPFSSPTHRRERRFFVCFVSGALGSDVQLLGRLWSQAGNRAQQGRHRGCVRHFCVFLPWRFIFCRGRLRCTKYPPAVRSIVLYLHALVTLLLKCSRRGASFLERT